MQVNAKVKFIKSSPRKTRLVIDLVRGLKVQEALDQLRFSQKWAAKSVSKLIQSAIANAEHNYGLDKNNLIVKEIKADGGPVLKRWTPRAQGRATEIRKRTSHINVVLSEIKDSGIVKSRKQKIDAPVKLGAQPKKEEDIKSSKEKSETKKLDKVNSKEINKEIVDPRASSRGGHRKIEGGGVKGFTSKMFQRKSG